MVCREACLLLGLLCRWCVCNGRCGSSLSGYISSPQLLRSWIRACGLRVRRHAVAQSVAPIFLDRSIGSVQARTRWENYEVAVGGRRVAVGAEAEVAYTRCVSAPHKRAAVEEYYNGIERRWRERETECPRNHPRRRRRGVPK